MVASIKNIFQSSLAIGNSELRNRNYAMAMLHYVNVLKNHPKLAMPVAINIRLTRGYFLKSKPACHLLIKQHKSSESVTNFEIALEQKKITKVIEHIPLENEELSLNKLVTIDIAVNNIEDLIVFYVAQNPFEFVHIQTGTPMSLLIGLMYYFIWGSEVLIFDKNSSFVSLDKYINEHLSVAMLCKLAIHINGLGQLTLHALTKTPAQSNNKSNIVWPKSYEILEQTYKTLSVTDSEFFLNNLFNLALGREPQSHEHNYYIGQLIAGDLSRHHLLEIVINGEESKTYLESKVAKNIIPQAYPHPILGEISPDEIEIPFYEKPLVSILIPVYQKIEYTLACLYSISKNSPKCTFEILILDDRSLDGSVVELNKIKNIRVIENPENFGFLKSCNHGVSYTNGEYIFFLNNDTQVRPGWLDELVLTFENFPGCGLVGSKLIFPDGKLQEAGGIIWKDGSAWNYGRGDDPQKPEYNYAREVDYCSGAAILIPKKLFIELGYFDERYIPAYCEDSDFAITVRNAGYRVIYQPKSEVIHFEGVSSGTDLNSGIKAYQVTNAKKQFNKWKNIFGRHRPNAHEPALERDRDAKGRILFIDACTPTPDKDSGSIDTFNLMIMFRDLGYFVGFIPEDNFAKIDFYTEKLQKNGICTIYHPFCSSIENHLQSYGDNYDVVMIFRPDVAIRSIDVVREYCKSAKIIFNTVDLHFLRLKREAELLNDINISLQSARYKKIEFDLFRKADISTVISSHEYDVINSIDQSINIFHLPYSRGIAKNVNSYELRNGILFVGGFQHAPNLDAIRYFVNEIFPILLGKEPDLLLHIVGSNCPDEIEKMGSRNIIVHGYVEDLSQLLQEVRVNLVPLRYGAGIKGKLGGAMALGLPSVSTPLGAEGMGILDGSCGVLIANDPISFSESILKLYNNRPLWEKFSQDALTFANASWGAPKLYGNLKNMFKKLRLHLPDLRNEVNLL